jgi:putative ABC transport system permease protein
LTIGLGAFAVVYTAVDKILIEPLPYEHPEDLYLVWRKSERFVITGPEAADLRQAGGVIERAAIFRDAPFALAGGGTRDAMRLRGLSVSPEMFDVLGVRPTLGRVLRPDETGPASPDVIILSDSLWRRLGGDRRIVGQTLTIGAQPFTVIGVMASDFRFTGANTDPVDAYLPLYDGLPAQPPLVGDWGALIRVRQGSSPGVVQQELDRRSALVDARVNVKRRGLRSVRLQDDMAAEIRPALEALAVAVGFLVLVLTVNLASLLLARAAAREKEFAVIRALGAGGVRIVRATLIEGALLGLVGAVIAAALGSWGVRVLVAHGPADLPRRESIFLDAHEAAVVITVGVVLGLLAAAAPAIWASRASMASLMATASVRGGAGTGRMRRGLVIVQVALSLVLLSAGALLAHSFERLLAADPGFRPHGVVTFGLGLSSSLFPDNASAYAFEDRVIQAVAGLPGVRRVGATTTLPLSGGGSVSWVFFTGQTDQGTAGYRIFIRAGYPETIGMRVIEGHAFEQMRQPGTREALIDRQMARHFFGGRSPLGATIQCDDRVLTIVGVVESPRLEYLHRDGRPQIFMRAEDFPERPWRIAARTDGDPRALLSEVQAIVRRLDRRVPVSEVTTMDDVVAERRSRERTSAVVVAGLAIGALLLVAAGLFGMVTGSVTRRRGELALRLALGATHRRIMAMVVGEGASLMAIGSVLAAPGVYLSGQAMRGLLVEVSPFDIPTLAGVAAVLAMVGLLACYLAARPVTTIDPERLLRDT